MGHGSQYHRGVGSLGTMRPMHVLKGKHMPGHMGNVQRTMQNLEIVKVDAENNYLMIKGNVPGSKGAYIVIKTAVKKPNTKLEKKNLVSYKKEEGVEAPAPAEAKEENTENNSSAE